MFRTKPTDATPGAPPTENELRFGEVRARDGNGWRIHLGAAMFYCFFLGWPTTFLEWAPIPLLVVWLVRVPRSHRVFFALVREPVVWLTLAFAAWQALSFIWTPDRAHGVKDFGQFRWALVLGTLWPVLDGRRWLIGAVAAGFVVGQCSQGLHLVGSVFEIESLTWSRPENRNSGWWDPAVAGTLLVGVVGLHLGGLASLEQPRARRLSTALAVVAGTGLAATGTRGAWLAAAVLVLLVAARVLVGRFRRARESAATTGGRARGPSLGALIGVSSVLVATAGVAWLTLGEGARARIAAGVGEVRGAIERGDFSTDTGARVIMLRWAVDGALEHPVRGLGVGGFNSYCKQRVAELDLRREAALAGGDPADRDIRPPRLHRHAHNQMLHTLCAQGVPGGVLLLLLALELARGGLRPRAPFEHTGPGWALVGLMLVSLFDSVLLNQQTAALWWTLAALSLGSRPREGVG